MIAALTVVLVLALVVMVRALYEAGGVVLAIFGIVAVAVTARATWPAEKGAASAARAFAPVKPLAPLDLPFTPRCLPPARRDEQVVK